MKIREFIKDYLTFTRKDRIGVFSVIALVAIIYLLPQFFRKESDVIHLQQDTSLVKSIDTLKKRNTTYSNENEPDENIVQYQYEPSQNLNFVQGELFSFDPNTLTVEGWRRLGLTDRTIKTIHNYRSKGGKFYKPEDLKKIWGMPEGFFERVENYINITSVRNNKPTLQPKYSSGYSGERKIAVVNVNEADTSAFIALPGIGSKLAYRITNFRDKLGGFYSVDQIKETYGLPDSTFQQIKPYLQVNASGIKKVNINTAIKDELKIHPYIKWNLANAIVEYRNQHGKYVSLEDLKKVILMDEVTFKKIQPYLTL